MGHVLGIRPHRRVHDLLRNHGSSPSVHCILPVRFPLAAMSSPSTDAPSAPSILTDEHLARIQKRLANSDFIPEGDAAIFARFDRKTGKTQYSTAGDINSEHILRLGSITKTLLSYIALKNDIPLEQTVFEAMPEYEPSKYASSDVITFRTLMNHLSGIVSYSELPDATKLVDFFTPQVILDLAWKDKPLMFQPGTGFFYSNTNSEVVATWLMKKTGLEPKDWYNAEFRDNGMPTLFLATAEARNFPSGSGYRNHAMPWHYPSVSGTLQGTAEDMMKAMDMMAKNTSIWENMQSWYDPSIPKIPDPENPAGGQKYGLFLQEYHFACGAKGIGHDGHIDVASFTCVIGDYIYLVHATKDYATNRWMEFCHSVVNEAFAKA